MTEYVEWTNGTSYTEGDRVFIENDPDDLDLFIATVSHTSSNTNKPLEGTNWQALWNPVNPNNNSNSKNSSQVSTINTQGTSSSSPQDQGILSSITSLFSGFTGNGSGGSGGVNNNGNTSLFIQIVSAFLFFTVVGFIAVFIYKRSSQSVTYLQSLREKQNRGEVDGFNAINDAFRDLINLTNPGKVFSGGKRGIDEKTILRNQLGAVDKGLNDLSGELIDKIRDENMNRGDKNKVVSYVTNIKRNIMNKLERALRDKGVGGSGYTLGYGLNESF